MPPVYLDYNATTPVDQRVVDAMLPWFLRPANAGSRTHRFGQAAKEAVDAARAQIADVLGAKSEEIIFTSGATEANNLAILGLAPYGERTGRKHILSTAVEHKAVLEPLEELSRRGFEVELVPVSRSGYIDADDIRKRLRSDTLLVTVMHANNETGVLQPIKDIAAAVRTTDAWFHTDAAQTFGKVVTDLRAAKPDSIAVSGHKIYGPQGIGALCLRRRSAGTRAHAPIMFGGGQERGLRPGTIPVALSVGLGLASSLAVEECEARAAAALSIKNTLLTCLQAIPHVINGDQAQALPTTLNVTLPGVDSEALMMQLSKEFAFSNGSACTVATYKPSHVLQAMGLSEDEVSNSVRFSFGKDAGEIETEPFLAAIRTLRG